MRRRHALLGLAFIFASLAGCGARPKLIRLYSGPERPASQVALISNTDVIRVHAIGMQIVGDDESAEQDTLDLLWVFAIDPGEQRIAVRYISSEFVGNGTLIHRSKNMMTFKTRFEAGKEYTFVVMQRNEPDRSLWIPVLVIKGTDKIAAMPEH